MQIDNYNLHCSNCKPQSQFVMIPAKDVRVTADLKTDEYRFASVCPKCNSKILNSRRAF